MAQVLMNSKSVGLSVPTNFVGPSVRQAEDSNNDFKKCRFVGTDKLTDRFCRSLGSPI